MVRQLTDGEDDDNSKDHPRDVGESAHALYAGLLLVPVECFHAVHKQYVEDADGDERYEQTDHEEQVRPRLTITNSRPDQFARHLYRREVTRTF